MKRIEPDFEFADSGLHERALSGSQTNTTQPPGRTQQAETAVAGSSRQVSEHGSRKRRHSVDEEELDENNAEETTEEDYQLLPQPKHRKRTNYTQLEQTRLDTVRELKERVARAMEQPSDDLESVNNKFETLAEVANVVLDVQAGMPIDSPGYYEVQPLTAEQLAPKNGVRNFFRILALH